MDIENTISVIMESGGVKNGGKGFRGGRKMEGKGSEGEE